MLDTSNPYATFGNAGMAAFAVESERTAFIRRTYLHLGGAIAAFVALEAILLTIVPMDAIMSAVSGRWTWLIVLGAFMGVSWLARSWAENGASPSMQYAGLSLYVVAEALIFLPIMAIAMSMAPNANIPMAAGLITLAIFGGLTLMAFVTKADFSWLGRYLWVAGLGAMGIAIAGICFGFSLGLFFSGAMVVLAAGYILYDTSNIQHHYRTDQHVAASLALFASVALLFYYILRILMAMRDR